MHEAANFDRFDFALRNWHETGPDPAHAPAKDRPMIGATIREERNLVLSELSRGKESAKLKIVARLKSR